MKTRKQRHAYEASRLAELVARLNDCPTDEEVIAAIRSVPRHFSFQAGYDKGAKWTVTGAS